MRFFLIAVCGVLGCSNGNGAPNAGCGDVPNKMLHEDYCAGGASALCLYDHPEGLGF